jgi:hypothetical protein
VILIPNFSDEELSKAIIRRIDRYGSILSELIASLEYAKIRTDNLTKVIREMQSNNIIKVTDNYRMPTGEKADAARGGSFQILIQKIVKLPDGTMGVEERTQIPRKTRKRIVVEDFVEERTSENTSSSEESE